MKLLAAEDDAISRRLLQSYLERWGYEATLAENGAEAWQLFQEVGFALVVTDWMMPEMDGVELIRRIRAHPTPGTVFILLLTAKSQKEDLAQGMEAGADDFLTKPFDREELRVRLRAGERIVRLEQSLEEQNRRLRETQASLGQHAARIAHEMNDAVAFLTNNLQLLQREVPAAMELLEKYRTGRPTLTQYAPDLASEIGRMEQALELSSLQQQLPRIVDTSLDGFGRVGELVRNLGEFAPREEAESGT